MIGVKPVRQSREQIPATTAALSTGTSATYDLQGAYAVFGVQCTFTGATKATVALQGTLGTSSGPWATLGTWSAASGTLVAYRTAPVTRVRFDNQSTGTPTITARFSAVPTVDSTRVLADQGAAGSASWLVADDFATFLSTHKTLSAGANSTIGLTTSVRMYRVTNWSTAARVLVKASTTVTGAADGSASRVGVAPAADVPNSEVFPITTTKLWVFSTAAAEVTVEAFRA